MNAASMRPERFHPGNREGTSCGSVRYSASMRPERFHPGNDMPVERQHRLLNRLQ